jgi:hypothetical protein
VQYLLSHSGIEGLKDYLSALAKALNILQDAGCCLLAQCPMLLAPFISFYDIILSLSISSFLGNSVTTMGKYIHPISDCIFTYKVMKLYDTIHQNFHPNVFF